MFKKKLESSLQFIINIYIFLLLFFFVVSFVLLTVRYIYIIKLFVYSGFGAR